MPEKLVKLHAPRHNYAERDSRFTQTVYKEAAPFFENPRGVLIHRVKAVFQLQATYSDAPWWIVQYWCENSGRGDANDTGLVFDPGVKLVCQRCEALAVAAGEPTSSKLAGRHVHTGKLRAVQTCCQNKKENN